MYILSGKYQRVQIINTQPVQRTLVMIVEMQSELYNTSCMPNFNRIIARNVNGYVYRTNYYMRRQAYLYVVVYKG